MLTGQAEPGYWTNPDPLTHKVYIPSHAPKSTLRILKVSLDYYRRESQKILQMFMQGLPGAEIGQHLLLNGIVCLAYICAEKASIDEAFIDLTQVHGSLYFKLFDNCLLDWNR